MSLELLKRNLKSHSDSQRAQLYQRFFKTGKGEYGHGDVFLGLAVPQQRVIAKQFYDLPLSYVIKLLHSKIHEERFTALVLMVHMYQKGDDETKDKVAMAYLKNTKWINNWDLVDTSTPQIVGDWCLRRGNSDLLMRLAESGDLWERRIGVLGTLAFIRARDVKPTLKIAKKLLNDKHDLIHKAVGWMLREAGKRDNNATNAFIRSNAARMPRTMLRYAIEKWPEEFRKEILVNSKCKIQNSKCR